jgi:hypothetical protein
VFCLSTLVSRGMGCELFVVYRFSLGPVLRCGKGCGCHAGGWMIDSGELPDNPIHKRSAVVAGLAIAFSANFCMVFLIFSADSKTTESTTGRLTHPQRPWMRSIRGL